MENNKNTFQVLLVEPNNIADKDWADADYIKSVLNEEYSHLKNVTFDSNPETYLKDIGELLNFNKFKKPIIESHVIGMDMEYIYEIIYMKFNTNYEDINTIKPNGVGVLFDMQGDDVFNNIIFQKLKYSIDDPNEKKYVDITIKDLEHLMYKRLNTTVVVYENDEFREEEIPGPTETFGKLFFEDEYSSVKKEEFVFLKHNLNIWYLKDNQFGTHITGDLLKDKPKIFKCAFFSLITNDRRDNLYLEELKKIIKLSNHLDNFTLNLNENLEDDYRKMSLNKYQILSEYSKNCIK